MDVIETDVAHIDMKGKYCNRSNYHGADAAPALGKNRNIIKNKVGISSQFEN